MISSILGAEWSTMFQFSISPLEIILRGTVVYLVLFIILRVVLKRESGSLEITDLLVIVLLADAAQNAMAGEYKSISDGLLLVTTIVLWSYFLDWLSFNSVSFRKLIKPNKLLIVKDGKMNKKNMRKELISEEELMSEIRKNGSSDINEVKEANMEPDGRISFIMKEEKQNPPEEKTAF